MGNISSTDSETDIGQHRGKRSTGAPQRIPSVAPVRTTVRVRTSEAAGAEPEQLLTSIKTHIPKAVAVKILHSGDVEVTLPNQQAKDQVITQGDTPECKILRQNYPVEVIGVPLSTHVGSGRGAANAQLIRKVPNSTRHPTGGYQRIHPLPAPQGLDNPPSHRRYTGESPDPPTTPPRPSEIIR